MYALHAMKFQEQNPAAAGVDVPPALWHGCRSGALQVTGDNSRETGADLLAVQGKPPSPGCSQGTGDVESRRPACNCCLIMRQHESCQLHEVPSDIAPHQTRVHAYQTRIYA